ncbi:MAG: carboxypeptidase-like regulatory domain-containing protein [Planctomycetales bacterium]|nr:carboxypeptidase-like regulatory domain-containing protein [Planctomycetales bacterium]
MRLYPPRRVPIEEVFRLHPELLGAALHDGLFQAHRPLPRIAEPVSDAARLGREPLVLYDPPAGSETPSEETRSGAEGRFELRFPAGGGTLVAEHPGFAARALAVEQAAEDLKVGLWPVRALHGRVVTDGGAPPPAPLALALTWMRLGEPKPDGTIESEDLGVSVVQTSADGTFRAEIGGPRVHPRSATPGWIVDPGFILDAGDAPVEIRVRRIPVLRVRDAATGAPIEVVNLQIHHLTDFREEFPRRAGRYVAPGGVVWLLDNLQNESNDKGTFRFSVWAEGYEIETRDVENPFSPAGADLEFGLLRGAAPRISGVVLDRGNPVEGAEVSLLSVGRTLQWTPDYAFLLDGQTTGGDGRFSLQGPAGEHRLRVVSSGLTRFVGAPIPQASPIVVDLSAFATVAVSVRDPEGQPIGGIQASFADVTRRPWWKETDPEGRAFFDGVPPGAVTISLSRQSEEMGWENLGDPQEVVLEPGERREVDFVLREDRSPDESRPLRLLVDSAPPGPGWRARLWGGDWKPVAEEGTLPVERGTVELASPTRRLWRFQIRQAATDDQPLRVSLAGAAYEGLLTARATGKPLPGVRVWATGSDGTESSSVGALTDSEGRFRLEGLGEAAPYLTFEDPSSQGTQSELRRRYESVSLRPSTPPSVRATTLTIRFPVLQGKAFDGIPVRVLRGRVTEKQTGRPLAKVSVLPQASLIEAEGTYLLHAASMMAESDADGHYRTTVPVSSHYAATVSAPLEEWGYRWAHFEWETSGSAEDEVRDFAVVWEEPARGR